MVWRAIRYYTIAFAILPLAASASAPPEEKGRASLVAKRGVVLFSLPSSPLHSLSLSLSSVYFAVPLTPHGASTTPTPLTQLPPVQSVHHLVRDGQDDQVERRRRCQRRRLGRFCQPTRPFLSADCIKDQLKIDCDVSTV